MRNLQRKGKTPFIINGYDTMGNTKNKIDYYSNTVISTTIKYNIANENICKYQGGGDVFNQSTS